LFNKSLVLYFLKMGRGQLNILINTQKIDEFLKRPEITKEQREKLEWIDKIKRYSVDSLGYKPTSNYSTYFEQNNQPLLWIVTACKPYSFEAYTWEFPMLGTVSYKGYFTRSLAQKEYLKLLREGYDADLSSVSAWSTLGWLPDPVLSSMLKRSKARLANLLFHELFHATYYAPGTVDVNENLANFISYKATLRFLQNDTVEMNAFTRGASDDSLFNAFVFEEFKGLEQFYKNSVGLDSLKRVGEKKKRMEFIYRKAIRLPFKNPARFEYAAAEILRAKNAFFIDAQRYDGLYDSLNKVLNNVYRGNLRAMIIDLKK